MNQPVWPHGLHAGPGRSHCSQWLTVVAGFESHCVKSAGSRLHLNTNTSLTQPSRSGLIMLTRGHGVGTYQGNELTSNSSGNAQPQSSQLAEPLLTDRSMKSGVCVRELISTQKQNKTTTKNTAQAGNEWSNIFSKSSQAEKKPQCANVGLCMCKITNWMFV